MKGIKNKSVGNHHFTADKILFNFHVPYLSRNHCLLKFYFIWWWYYFVDASVCREDFVYYANICFKEFGDRVKNWITVNEPNLISLMGYILGWFPPARCSPPFGNCSAGNSDIEPLIVVHNMLLSHAKAVQLYRKQYLVPFWSLDFALCFNIFVHFSLVVACHGSVPFN